MYAKGPASRRKKLLINVKIVNREASASAGHPGASRRGRPLLDASSEGAWDEPPVSRRARPSPRTEDGGERGKRSATREMAGAFERPVASGASAARRGKTKSPERPEASARYPGVGNLRSGRPPTRCPLDGSFFGGSNSTCPFPGIRLIGAFTRAVAGFPAWMAVWRQGAASRLPCDAAVDAHLGRRRDHSARVRPPLRQRHHAGRHQAEAGERETGEVA